MMGEPVPDDHQQLHHRLRSMCRELRAALAREGGATAARRALLAEILAVLSTTDQALHRLEAELDAVRRRHEAFLDFAPAGYVVTDPDGVVRQVNRAYAALIRRPAAALVGKPLLEHLAEGERPSCVRRLDALLESGGEAGDTWESCLALPGGDEVPVVITVAADLDGDGAVQGVWWSICDLRDQKAAQEALVQAERQALIGRLASSLAHEIGNPLQTVVGCIGLSEEALQDGDGDRAMDLLKLGREELLRAGDIVDRLRNVTRGSEPGDLAPTDLNALIEEVLTLAGKHVRTHDIDLVWEPDPELPKLSVAPDRMRQVFLNLILNAVEAMDGGGRLEVRCARQDEQVCISVRDTGPGIPPEQREKLFTPFHTTKATGMGLGLYITKQIVDEHAGTIAVDTGSDRGTTFTVRLPLKRAAQ
ncbi:MAG: two-component system sensor histidine kinase NtrB, partial [Anaerolineae bacterium]